MDGIETIGEVICADMRARLPGQNKKQREGFSLLVSCHCRLRASFLKRASEEPTTKAIGKLSGLIETSVRPSASHQR